MREPAQSVSPFHVMRARERLGHALARAASGPDSCGDQRHSPIIRCAPWLTYAQLNMTRRKSLYLANPYGFSAQLRSGPLAGLVASLEALGAEVWEPFARNNQVDRTVAGWAWRIGQADLNDVRRADGLFAVLNGCPPDEGVMVELGMAIAWNTDLPVPGRLPPLHGQRGVSAEPDDLQRLA